MPKITSSPSADRFAQAWAEEFNDAVKRAAGDDGRITARELKKMVERRDGDQFYADDVQKYLDNTGQRSVSIAKLKEWSQPYALAAAAKVDGPDGKISFSDATKLPPSLVEDFFLLRGRALPSGPASEMVAVENALVEKTANLLMPSETDAKFAFVSSTRFEGGEITEQVIRSLLTKQHDALLPTLMAVPASEVALSTRAKVEVKDAAEFLAKLGTASDPNDPASQAQAQKFRELTTTLNANLSDIKIYRFGERNLSVFIVGRTRVGELAGLLTGQVET